jgi:hypothetical protein
MSESQGNLQQRSTIALQQTGTASSQEPARSGVTRLIAGYAAIIFMLPYLAIKIAWISGLPLGMPNKSLVTNLAMIALNILTFCMDAVAILLALAFTHSWGLHVPAWLLLFPMWVGTGFLAPIVVAVPMNVLARALGLDSGQSPSSEQALVEPWVLGVVFTSFIGQWVALITAFILYARARWGSLLRLRTADSWQPHQIIVFLGNAASMIATAIGLLHLLWAGDAPFGLPPAQLPHATHATFGLTALSGAIGAFVLVNRLGRWPLWFPLSLAWTGAGAMFSWGAWLVLVTVLRFSRGEGAWLFTGANVVKTGAGLLIGALIGLMAAATARR